MKSIPWLESVAVGLVVVLLWVRRTSSGVLLIGIARTSRTCSCGSQICFRRLVVLDPIACITMDPCYCSRRE